MPRQRKRKQEVTYHPPVSTFTVDKVARNLAGGLDDQKTTETLAELEDRSRPSQKLIPASDCERFDKTFFAKDPFPDRLVLCPLPTERLFHPATACIRVYGELVKTPDQQGRNDDPLQPSDGLAKGPAESRSIRSGQTQSGIEEVEAAQGQRKCKATGASANIEGQRDGKDDAEEEKHRR